MNKMDGRNFAISGQMIKTYCSNQAAPPPSPIREVVRRPKVTTGFYYSLVSLASGKF